MFSVCCSDLIGPTSDAFFDDIYISLIECRAMQEVS